MNIMTVLKKKGELDRPEPEHNQVTQGAESAAPAEDDQESA
jgi:hypothetical protein